MDKNNVVPKQDLLSLEEAAEFLYVSKSTLYRLLGQAKLRGMKAGKQWRFHRADLLAYMQRGPAALALANLPIEVLDAELKLFADELERAGASTVEADDTSLVGEAGKIAQLVRRMIWLLYSLRGSDLHLEPLWEGGKEYTRVRMRVDGELRDITRLPSALHEPLVLEWKQRAGLLSEERSRPQESSAQLIFSETLVPLRVSIVPTLNGERVAVRIIESRVPTLAELGIPDAPLKNWMSHARGMVLFTGPTGSGKSTTRAACVHELLKRSLNIMAVESQVQYLFPSDVAQLKAEQFTCSEGLRAIMQQDPDVILVGDLLGDPELARRSAQAAELGHLVLACLHAYDSISPLYDFLEWGVKRSLLVGNIIGIVSQQLVARLCDACKIEQIPEKDFLAEIKKSAQEGGYLMPESAVFYAPTGCQACKQWGYVGRLAMHEYFTFTPALKAAFLRGASQEEFTKLVREQGQLSSFAVGVQMAVEGKISLDDVLRRFPRGLE